jgi:hypothetical protein
LRNVHITCAIRKAALMEIPVSSPVSRRKRRTAVVEALRSDVLVLGSGVDGSRNIAQAALIGTPEERSRVRPPELKADLS